jgi:hypothetical protein
MKGPEAVGPRPHSPKLFETSEKISYNMPECLTNHNVL